ncbi:MAG TPA: class I adenylate-forming enzyme family protein [Candidatus Methylacidiphilales bacterium]|nr:class I adenylate-forming enzyme family protein [Candidatus Methylacidiphilales bacterium]
MIMDEIRAQAQRQPGHPALVSVTAEGGEQVLSYGELMTAAEKAAAALTAGGVRRGDRCGMLASQGAPFIIQALGILEAGLCFVPISEDYAGDALAEFAQNCRLHYLIREDEDFVLKRFENPGFVDGNEDRDYLSLQPAYLRFTSGTTNQRKGVLIGHEAILARLAGANRALKIGPRDKIMWMLPMAHHFVVSILLYLRYGATILLPANYLAESILSLANSREATIFYASPYQYDMLAKDKSGLMLKSVRLAISTASGLNLQVAASFRERMDIALSQALGVIEMGLPVINIDHAREKPLSLGRVLPDYEVWLRDDDGKPVQPDGTSEALGEVCIRGPGCFDAYLNPWTPARKILEPDGFCTGDQGYFDAEGDLFLMGRRHNRINMAGMKFFCEEVEAVINQFPGVKESRVMGKTHPRVGEIPIAEIVPEDPAAAPDIKELMRHCQKHLAAHKVPISFSIVENLPYTPTGKIRRW